MGYGVLAKYAAFVGTRSSGCHLEVSSSRCSDPVRRLRRFVALAAVVHTTGNPWRFLTDSPC